MKRSGLTLALFAVLPPIFASALTPVQKAAKDFAEAQAEYAQFQKARALENESVLKEIAELQDALAKAQTALSKTKDAALQPQAAAAEVAHFEKSFREILADLDAFENLSVGIERNKYKNSPQELCALAAKRLNAFHALVFAPQTPRKISFEADFEGGVKTYDGLFWRSGSYAYFAPANPAEPAFMILGFEGKRPLRLYGYEFSEQIRAYLKDPSAPLPQDPFFGRKKSADLNDMSFTQTIIAGGIWMYPIIIFGAAALFMAVYKCARIFKIGRARKDAISKIFLHLERGDENGAFAAAQSVGEPYSEMLTDLLKNKLIGAPLLEELAYEHMLVSGEKIYHGLGLISITASIAPLLGLLGTVTGIIKTFGNLSVYGSKDPAIMSQGIGEALITTEFGLAIAIPAFVIHALLSRRAKAILSDMEKLASAFLSKTHSS